MVDALVLEASTSVCGFESHLPHQIKTASLFDWLFLFGGACGRVIRYAQMRGKTLMVFPSHSSFLPKPENFLASFLFQVDKRKGHRKVPFSFGARCGGGFRFALCMAGTCGSPTHAPLFFVIPYSLRSKLTAPTTDRGLEPNRAPGFFFAPNLRRSSRRNPN